jgi:hypothetical protein
MEGGVALGNLYFATGLAILLPSDSTTPGDSAISKNLFLA